MKTNTGRERKATRGSALVIVVAAMLVLMALGLGLMTVAWSVRLQAIRMTNETIAMLAAEAGYEKAIFKMSQQMDMLSALQNDLPEMSGRIDFPNGYCEYEIELYTFIGYRPVYRVISTGHSGMFNRTVDTYVVQAVSGWDMGMCRVPTSPTTTSPVYYANEEIIDMPLHINKFDDSSDYRDIHILGSPQFLQPVAMGESRYTTGGYDKYTNVMHLFDGGIYFDQPDCRVTDEDSVQSKVDRFKENTKPKFRFKPVAKAPVENPKPVVQLEFFVCGKGVGKVRITNNCTVRGFKQTRDSRTYDFKIEPGSDGTRYERYDIYAYHLKPTAKPVPRRRRRRVIAKPYVAQPIRAVELEPVEPVDKSLTKKIAKTYVRQSVCDVESEPGGQIFVDGNVIIGSEYYGQMVVKGKITVVATGNIWIADSIVVDGPHDADGKPSMDNPNVLGLIAQGVIKVVDPGMSDYSYVDDTPEVPEGHKYVPIGLPDSGQSVDLHKRHLPDPMVIEAAITVGGGGWGAENVRRSSYGGRKEASGNQDNLIVRGSIAEAIRGVVGLIGSDGYVKRYYLDERLLEGILPGDIWLQGKYIPAPAGWHDYRPTD